MSTTSTSGTDRAHTDPDLPVVYWPDPSPLRPWWDTIMQPAMPAAPAAQRSPDPRHPRARNPHARKHRTIGALAGH